MRSGWRRRVFGLVLGAVLPAGSPAWAGSSGGTALPPLDPPGVWRTMTTADATTTSRCLGRPPATPLCAIENILGCFMRAENELCRLGRGAYRPPNQFGPYTHVLKYRVVSAKRVRRQDIPRYAPDEDPRWFLHPGDLLIGVETTDCGQECGVEPYAVTTYTVRRKGRHWFTFMWDTPRG